MDTTLFKIGGISLLSLFGLYLIGIVLYAVGKQTVSSSVAGHTALTDLTKKRRLFHATNIIFHLGSLLIIPALFALYEALKDANGSLALIGAGFAGAGIAVAGWIFGLNFALARLATKYTQATTEIERAALAAATDLDLAMQAGGEILFAILFCIWILFSSLAMLSSKFPASTAYFGLITGATGIVGQIGASATSKARWLFIPLAFLSILLEIIWFLIIGLALLAMG
jgi:hypothetical protein